MKNLPTLEKERISLIPSVLTQKTLNLYSKWLEQPEIKKGIGQLEKLSGLEVFELLKEWKENPLKMHWFIYLKEEDLLVGDLNLDILLTRKKKKHQEFSSDSEFSLIQNKAEIKIMISDDYRRKGIGRLATEAAIDYGFNQRRLNAVYASVYEDNIGSKKLFENLGFEKRYFLREKRTGRDEWIMRLMKS